MMPITSALHHLYQKVASDPNSTDNEIKAMNSINDYITENRKEFLKENVLLAKLYTLHFGTLFNHYKDIEFAQKELHSELRQSLEFHANLFRINLNQVERRSFILSKGLSLKRDWQQSEEQRTEENRIIIENQEEFLKHTNRWTQEEINKKLNEQISDAINMFRNYE